MQCGRGAAAGRTQVIVFARAATAEEVGAWEARVVAGPALRSQWFSECLVQRIAQVGPRNGVNLFLERECSDPEDVDSRSTREARGEDEQRLARDEPGDAREDAERR